MKAHRLLILVLLAGGCSFKPKGGGVDFGASDLGSGVGGGSDGDLSAPDDLGGGGGGGGGDMMGMACTTQCLDAMTLQSCDASGTATSSSCALGCNPLGAAGPHCKQLVPTAPVKPADLDGSDLTAPPALSAAYLSFDASTGSIVDIAHPGNAIREANGGNGREVKQGIAFHVAKGVAIWSFKGLTIPAGTTLIFADSQNVNNAVALVSSTDAEIDGTIDGRGYADVSMPATSLCSSNLGGPGGGVGGTMLAAASGDGAGRSATALSAGGGGGGFGALGGVGGGAAPPATMPVGGAAGPMGSAGDLSVAPIMGGFGGGFGGANGGGGGGGVQIVANGTLTFGATGKINVGGCGGQPGLMAGIAGGGGGSGGAVLAEALTINVTAGAFIAANGGGGGGGGDPGATKGSDGATASAATLGGTPGATGYQGGNGGSAHAAAGSAGENFTGPVGGGGGGGGAAGRIRLATQSGTTNVTDASLSPTLAENLATQGPASVQ